MGFERIDAEEVFSGKLIRVLRERYRHDDGDEVEREKAVHPGAAVIVAHDGERVYLVTQPREVVGEEALLELPAGKLDAGEEPLACARRELAEEIGMRAEAWEPLGECYASPGFSDERYHLFLATGLSLESAPAEEEERIEVEPVPLGDLGRAIERCRDAKSLIGLLLLERRLRRG